MGSFPSHVGKPFMISLGSYFVGNSVIQSHTEVAMWVVVRDGRGTFRSGSESRPRGPLTIPKWKRTLKGY